MLRNSFRCSKYDPLRQVLNEPHFFRGPGITQLEREQAPLLNPV